MTNITLPQKKDMIELLSRPMRYSEFRLCLSGYIKNTAYRHMDSFEDALRRDGVIVDIPLKSENGKMVTLYSSSSASSAYNVAMGLCHNGYFCNLTALYFHGLTNQVPKVIYMAKESIREYPGRVNSDALKDNDIFSCFIKKPRISKSVFKFDRYLIVLTERVNRRDVGVEPVNISNRVCPKGSRVASLERGLIDAVVHPQYNGGISSVVEFYRAGAKHVKIGKLLQIYKTLDFRYPYWQAIGFVFDKVGATKVAAEISDHFRARNRFYIDHLAKDSWDFDSKWQIYYPKGLFNDNN